MPGKGQKPTFRKSDVQRMSIGSLDLPICKICNRPIRKDEPRIWKTNPMGLSHDPCPDNEY